MEGRRSKQVLFSMKRRSPLLLASRSLWSVCCARHPSGSHTWYELNAQHGDLFKLYKILLFQQDNIALQCGYGLISSMLEPHAKSAAGLTQVHVGMVFLTLGAAYMVQAPIIGQV